LILKICSEILQGKSKIFYALGSATALNGLRTETKFTKSRLRLCQQEPEVV